MRSLISVVVLCSSLSLFAAAPAGADTDITENIAVDTTWDIAGSPYIVHNTVIVTSGSTLTIDPGVTVKLETGAGLSTQGGTSIQAVGTQADPILFTSNAVAPSSGDWYALYVRESSTSSFIYCTLEYSQYGIYADLCSPTVSFCLFHDNNTGLTCEKSSPHVTSCDFIENSQGMRIYGPDSSPVIHYCNMYDNSSENIYVTGYDALPQVVIDAEENWWGADSYLEIGETIYISISAAPYVAVDYDPWLHEIPVESISWGRIKSLFSR